MEQHEAHALRDLAEVMRRHGLRFEVEDCDGDFPGADRSLLVTQSRAGVWRPILTISEGEYLDPAHLEWAPGVRSA